MARSPLMESAPAPTNAELAAAIESLRRARARDRLVTLAVGLAVGVVASATAAHGAPPAASLDVRQLILRDDAGNARAKLAMGEGGPRLAFADTAGHARLVMGTDGGGSPILAMADDKAVVRIW